jgi:hypothetical protein
MGKNHTPLELLWEDQKLRRASIDDFRPMRSSNPDYPLERRIDPEKWDEQVFRIGKTVPMKKAAQHLIAEVPGIQSKVEMTIGIDLGDVWSHYCTLNEAGEVIDRGRFRTSPKGVEKWFSAVPPARVAMEAGTHSIWISEQIEELGHEVIVANVRELRAISHSDRKERSGRCREVGAFRTA